jgi:hypothetical protein
MFLVTEADADAIRTIFNEEGELSAAIELRRRFPGITDNVKARAHVRTISGWKSLPAPSCSVIQLRPRFVRAKTAAQLAAVPETPVTDPAR